MWSISDNLDCGVLDVGMISCQWPGSKGQGASPLVAAGRGS